MFKEFISRCAVFKIMWKNIAGPKRPQITILPIGIACLITKATNTNSEYIILIVFHCNNGYMNASEFCVKTHCATRFTTYTR